MATPPRSYISRLFRSTLRGMCILGCEKDLAVLLVFRAILPEKPFGAKIIEDSRRHFDAAAPVGVFDGDYAVLTPWELRRALLEKYITARPRDDL